eukprot:82753_1
MGNHETKFEITVIFENDRISKAQSNFQDFTDTFNIHIKLIIFDENDLFSITRKVKYRAKVQDVIDKAIAHVNKEHFPHLFSLEHLLEFNFSKSKKTTFDMNKNEWVTKHKNIGFASMAATERQADWRLQYAVVDFDVDPNSTIHIIMKIYIAGIQISVHTINFSSKTNALRSYQVPAAYNDTIQDVVDQAKFRIDRETNGIILDITDLYWTVHSNGTSLSKEETLNDFSQEIIRHGLTLEIKPKQKHIVIGNVITCPYMLQSTDMYNVFSCPVYKAMKGEYEFTESTLLHLKKYNHYQDEYSQKPDCRYHENCYAYKRLELGGNRFNDQCHVKMYKHPPRRRINLLENQEMFNINHSYIDNAGIYTPTDDDYKVYDFTTENGFLRALLQECASNGFEKDLYLPDDDTKTDYSIMKIVEDKMDHPRHKLLTSPLNKGEMLSVIMYTGCDSNYDLCKFQRMGNYKKWRWFDYCLWNAINKLNKKESGQYKLYTG